MPNRSPLDLLEPGNLLSGALFRSLVARAGLEGRLAPGTRLGPFRVSDEIGAGGMGVVYRAERDDGQFQQHVAIKCVAGSGSELQRVLFRRERQILAGIRHPHIARLLDGGELDDGRLWFAMELVDGARVDEHARQHGLSVEQRIGLLRQALAAVAYAHERLLLHRDIKPGNVLVDTDGVVKLLDFGIAALVGEDDIAQGYSPRWASPEQLAGNEPGPASDQYQLGLLLDAVLRAQAPAADPVAGEPRVAAQWWLPMPAARRAELWAILQRATAPQAAQRYRSVAEFDADLARWLERRPVLAHAGGFSYTLRCAVRRHPWAAAASAAAALTIAALVLGFSWRLAQERDLARAAAARATREAQTAEAISRFLQDDLLALADPNLSQDAGLEVRTLLGRAAASVDAKLGARPEIAAQIHATLARGLRGLGELAAAQARFEHAQSLLATLPASDPRRLQLDLWLGELELARSQPTAALARLQRVAAEAARTLGADAPLALEAALREAIARFELGEQPQAVAAVTALSARLDRALGVDAPLAIHALNRLAIMLNAVERLADSERVRDEHLARATAVYGAGHSVTLTGRLNRAALLRKLKRLPEAYAEAQAAEDGLREVFGFPSIAVLHAMHVRSNILQNSGRTAEAIELQRQTLAGRIALLGAEHDDVAFSHVNLGSMLTQAGDYSGAIEHLLHALEIRRAKLPEDHVDVITNLVVLSDTERRDGRIQAAQAHAAEAVTRARRALAPDRPERANALYRHAQALAAGGDTAAAKSTGAEALAGYERSMPPTHPRLGEVRAFLAGLEAR